VIFLNYFLFLKIIIDTEQQNNLNIFKKLIKKDKKIIKNFKKYF
jgi:hypothetical protein